jgi:hypothetical protein
MAQAISITTLSNRSAAVTLSGSASWELPLSFSVMSGPAHGTLSGTAGGLTYTPSVGFIGQDSFTYIANDGYGSSSPALVNITVFEPGSPLAPTELTATAVSSTEIALAWTDNAVREDGFLIERSNDNNSWKLVGTVTANVHSFSNAGLVGNRTYAYRVRAFNQAGFSAYSNVSSTKTLK